MCRVKAIVVAGLLPLTACTGAENVEVTAGDLETVWSAHAREGTRVRASTDGVTLRHTVVEMPDLASAEDGRSGPRDVEGSDLDDHVVPAGDDGGLFVDLDSANPWQVLEPVLEAAAGRLTGDPSPVLVRKQASTTTATRDVTATDPGERPTSTGVSPPAGDDWKDHDAAVFVPDPTLFGPGFVLDRVTVLERQPSDPDDAIEGCPVDPPPQLDGLRVQYDDESGTAEIEVQVGIDDAAWAQGTVDAFRPSARVVPWPSGSTSSW